MKKLLMIAAISALAWPAMAQKFLTRTGKVTFFSSTKMEDIKGVNNEVTAVLNADNGEVVYVLPVKSFKFEKQLMQEHFNENYMESDKYPKAEYKGKIKDLSAVNFAKDGVYNVTSTGKMTIHGVTRDITAPATITLKAGVVTVTSKFMVNPSDYNIKIPALVVDKIAKNIEVTVNTALAALKK